MNIEIVALSAALGVSFAGSIIALIENARLKLELDEADIQIEALHKERNAALDALDDERQVGYNEAIALFERETATQQGKTAVPVRVVTHRDGAKVQKRNRISTTRRR